MSICLAHTRHVSNQTKAWIAGISHKRPKCGSSKINVPIGRARQSATVHNCVKKVKHLKTKKENQPKRLTSTEWGNASPLSIFLTSANLVTYQHVAMHAAVRCNGTRSGSGEHNPPTVRRSKFKAAGRLS